MKWQIILFPLLAAALPPQKEIRSRSSVQPRSAETNNTKGHVWSFDPTYNPDALVVESEISGPYYSKENWNFRNVGKWLIEYAAQQNVACSDDFFVALYKTDAFGRDSQEVCGITPAGDNCNGGHTFDGFETPFKLTNNEFNAQMVRQAIRNTYTYYRTLWEAIVQAEQDVGPSVGLMVTALEKPLAVKRDGLDGILETLGAFIQFAAVFFPVEGVISSIAEDVVKTELQSAKAGSVFFSISEDAQKTLVDATTKELTKGYSKMKDVYTTGKNFIGKLAAAQDDPKTDPDAHLDDVLDYQAGADKYAQDARYFLENTWSAILNQGFSDGGIISQIFTGDVLDINAPTTGSTLGTTDDHGSDKYDTAVEQYFRYLVQRSMTQILRDHGVMVIKRGSYDSHDDCMSAYRDYYLWVDDSGRGCFADTDNPDKFSQYFPMVRDTSKSQFNYKMYTGAPALFGAKWGEYQFDGSAFYQGATICTASNGLWTDAQDKINTEFTPQYMPPRISNDASEAPDASQLVCSYSVPVCDYEDSTFIAACKVYKGKMYERVKDLAGQKDISMDDHEGDTGACADREMFYFCLLAVYQGSDDLSSFDDTANQYVNLVDTMGYWGGLAGFEAYGESHPVPVYIPFV